MTKICTKCKTEKSLLAFGKDRHVLDGLNRRCKQCIKDLAHDNPEKIKASSRKTYLKHRDKRLAEMNAYIAALSPEVKTKRSRIRKLKTYGMTLESFGLLSKLQRDCCAICGEKTKTKLHVDHCHATGKVRGLLCLECNTGLGKFKDSPHILKAAIDYLQSGGVLE